MNFNNDYLVSVVIPTYNRRNTIKRAIDSVLKQTYKNIEIIVVDDNSTDDTEDIVRESYKNINIKYVKHAFNRGGSAARNTGVTNCNGDFIAFLDSDDEWFETKIEKQLEIFKENKQIGIVYASYNLVNENTGEILKFHNKTSDNNPYLALLCKNYIGTTSSVVVRKQALLDIKGFDETLPSCQDWDLYIRIASKNEVGYVDEVLLNYYFHNSSITGSIEKVIKGHEMLSRKVREIIDNNSNLYKYRNKVIARHYINFANIYIRFDKFLSGQRYFINALKLEPLNITAAKHLIVSLLGKKLYFRFKKIK